MFLIATCKRCEGRTSREATLTKIRDALVAAPALPKLFVSVSLPGELLEAAGPPEARPCRQGLGMDSLDGELIGSSTCPA